ncbi:MAG: hypothetical protein SOY94_01245 [Candidatus Limiplasma sp.]|nr:hypothetical protein [Candidatus Limiplasma sp.]
MANFPQYQYQPQQMGYQPQQMQPVYQQYQQPMQNQQEAQLFCRPVASADEARGVPVDFTGRPMVFTHLSAGKIYVKVFDQGSGSAVFREFRMCEEPAQETAAQTAAAYAPLGVVDEIKNLKEHLAALQDEIRGMKRRRAQNVEVNTNDE